MKMCILFGFQENKARKSKINQYSALKFQKLAEIRIHFENI
jgi:hypothetical protein